MKKYKVENSRENLEKFSNTSGICTLTFLVKVRKMRYNFSMKIKFLISYNMKVSSVSHKNLLEIRLTLLRFLGGSIIGDCQIVNIFVIVAYSILENWASKWYPKKDHTCGAVCSKLVFTVLKKVLATKSVWKDYV